MGCEEIDQAFEMCALPKLTLHVQCARKSNYYARCKGLEIEHKEHCVSLLTTSRRVYI